MFVGSIDTRTRKYPVGQMRAFAGRTVVVGCSGNFTFEGLLAAFGSPAAVHGNDVSFYSCALGRWLAGDPVEFTLTDAFAWLAPYCGNNDDRAARRSTREGGRHAMRAPRGRRSTGQRCWADPDAGGGRLLRRAGVV